MKSVKASFAEKEADKILLSEKEGGIRARRRYRPSNPFRTPRMDMLGLQEANQQISAIAKLHGGNR